MANAVGMLTVAVIVRLCLSREMDGSRSSNLCPQEEHTSSLMTAANKSIRICLDFQLLILPNSQESES